MNRQPDMVDVLENKAGPDWRGRRIVHVIAGLGFGGTEALCRSIVNAGRGASGLEGRVVALAGGEPAQAQAQIGAFETASGSPVEVLPFPPAQRARMMVWFIRYLRRVKPDGIIVYAFGLPHVVIALAARMAGAGPVVVSAGNTVPEDAGSRRKWATIIRLSRVLGVRIVSASQAIEASLTGLGVPLPAGSRVIHNGCDIDAIATEAAVARKEGGPLIAGMVARMDPIKDHMTLLKAWAQLCRSSVPGDRELWIIGDGELRREMEAQTRSLGIEGSVRFLGACDDVPHLLGQMDIFVFATSAAEGFGIVLIEAMAAGLPIIASDVPACREVIGDEGAGILVEPHSPQMLTEALEDLFAHSEKRAGLALAGGKRVRAHFDISATARGYAEAAFEGS